MKTTPFKALTYLLLLCILPLFGGCNQEDNLEAIFLGKTWKLTGIFRDKNDKQLNTCGTHPTEECLKDLDDLKNKSGYFTLTFNSLESLSGRAATSTFEGRCAIDGKKNTFETSISTSADADLEEYGNMFLSGIKNAYRYWGDHNALKIYYKEGGEKKYLLFRVYNK